MSKGSKETMVHAWQAFEEVQEQIGSKGAFLTGVVPGGTPNPMTIGWGLIGVVWGRPIFQVLVRPSRYTDGLIERTRAFTVSVPLPSTDRALALCGTESGRDLDKLSELGIGVVPGKRVPVPTLDVPGMHYECRVVAKTALVPGGLLSAELRDRYYPRGDLHNLYFGEILSAERRGAENP